MYDVTSGSISTLICARQSYALSQLHGNSEYRKELKKREKRINDVESIIKGLKEEEINAIMDLIENGDESQCMENDAIYLGGMKDCFDLLLYLSGLQDSLF